MNLNARRRLVVGSLIVLGLLFAATHWWSRAEGGHQKDTSAEAASSTSGTRTGAAIRAKRRSFEGCNPSEASIRHEDLVGSRASAILAWTGVSKDTANLRIPVFVVGIENDAVAVRFLDFPMREQYLHIWLGSGHIEAAPESVFLLAPCSAALAPWPVAPDR